MFRSKLIASYSITFICFLILFIRYAFLQLIDHGLLLKQSVDNYSSIVATTPVRGGILDRNNVILADNKASYAISVLPKDAKNPEELFKKLSKYVEITSFDKKKYYAQLRKSKNFDWVIIKDDLNDKQIANLTAHNFEYSEVSVFARSKRYYPFDNMYSHSISYVGRISAKDQERLSDQVSNYLANDYIGKNGLEKYYESILRGKIGKKIIRTDATGNEVGLIANNPASDGYTIKLTVDHKLQKLAWDLLGDRSGAVVAINPQDGGILAFVSKPGFNPNWFIDGISIDDWNDLSGDENKPLLNRASQGSYPPGSTFKPLLALGALFLNVRSINYTMNDPGYYILPGSSHRFRDSQPHGLGVISMFDAIRLSSDAYFYDLGFKMGIDRIDQAISLFGLGQKTLIDLPEENTGLLPSKAWKAKRFAKDPYQKNWLPADSVNVGIGQGFNHYTPLQMAHAVSIIADEGTSYQPHFLNQVLDKNGHVIEQYKPISHELPIAKSDFLFMKRAMEAVVNQGTAASIGYDLKYTMAGKTGTAQVVALSANSRQSKFSGSKYKDHSWFIAFAPVDKPQIAIAVIVEHAGWGATGAAPIARKLFDAYLFPENNSESSANNVEYKKYNASDLHTDDEDYSYDQSQDDEDDSDSFQN